MISNLMIVSFLGSVSCNTLPLLIIFLLVLLLLLVLVGACLLNFANILQTVCVINKSYKTDPPKLGSAFRVNVFSGLPDQLGLPESNFKNFDWSLQPNGSRYE